MSAVAVRRSGMTGHSLNEVVDTYYDVIRNPPNASKFDITWADWGAEWSSASTVIPPSFDSRVNPSAASNGQDYEYYTNGALNKEMDEAYATADLDQQAAKWGDIDERLAKDVAYILLRLQRSFLIWVSGVKSWIDNPSRADYPDLGALGVKLR